MSAFCGAPPGSSDEQQRLKTTFGFLFAGSEDAAVGRLRNSTGLRGELADAAPHVVMATPGRVPPPRLG